MAKPICIVKIGGALITESGAPGTFWDALKEMRSLNEIALVHGGGPHATRVARLIGHEPRFVHGRRVTSDLDLEIVQWTIRGALNVRLVAQAQTRGISAVGLCGADDALVQVHRRPPKAIDGAIVDFGWVGDVDGVNTGTIELLLRANRLPIIAPMGIDPKGQLYNVNADTVAMQIAAAISATQLVLATESGGVQRTPGDPDSCIQRLRPADRRMGVEEGWITAGMRAKLEVAAEALAMGIPSVRIVDASEVANPDAGTNVVAA